MPWQILMLAQNLVAAGGILYTRKLSRRYGKAYFQVLAIIMGMMYLFGISFVLASEKVLHLDVIRAYAPLFLLTGLGFTLSYALTHRVFEHVDAAVGSLYGTLNIIGVIIASTLIIKEGLTWHQLAGAVMLLGAMAMILSVHTTHRRHERWLHALLYSAAAAICFGLALTAEKFLLDRTNLQTYILFGWGAQFFWAVLLGLLWRRREFRLLRKPAFLHDTMITGGLRAATGFLFMLALIRSDNSSLAAVWSGLRVLLAAALAAAFLHERQFLTRKIEASIIAMAAIAFLLW